MDTGWGFVIAACVPTVAGFFNEWRANRRAKRIAAQLIEANIQVATDLAIHNAQVGRELEKNTELTKQTQEGVTAIKEAVINGHADSEKKGVE